MENKEQVTVTQSHIKEIYTEHRGRKERGMEGRKEERKEGRREGGKEQQGDEFGFFRPQGSRGCFVMAGYLGSLN